MKKCECTEDRLCEKCAGDGARMIQKILKLNNKPRRNKMELATLSNTTVFNQKAKAVSITLVQAILLILASTGKIFTVTYIKRTDNMTRVMNARLGVKKELKGKKRNYNPALKGLITVRDMQKKEYRTVDANSILALKIGGKNYEVTK